MLNTEKTGGDIMPRKRNALGEGLNLHVPHHDPEIVFVVVAELLDELPFDAGIVVLWGVLHILQSHL